MYETYVPTTETTVERKPPTIADIVRAKTGNGAHIVDFFLDLMEGRVDDARLCHRIDAAKQLVKYGSKDAADFIAHHRDETCDHCESRKRGPRTRKDASPAAGPTHAPGPYGYDFLTLLTEDFLTVLSAVDEDLMIMLLRAQTRDGGTVIDFLDNVMHGREDGFKAHHRIAAAKELIAHILRDEHRSHTSAISARKIVVPAQAGTQGGGEGQFEPAEESAHPETNPIVVPAEAGTQRGGEGRSEHDEPNSVVVPAKAGTQRSGGTGAIRPSRAGVHPEPNSTVVPAKAGTQGGGGARVAVANSADPEPVLSTVGGPKIVRPELVEEPAPCSIRGQCSAYSAVPGPAADEADLIVVPAEAGFLPQEPSPTQGGGEGRSGSQLRTNNRQPRTLPRRRRHEPDPWDGPDDSTHPGRSPPWN